MHYETFHGAKLVLAQMHLPKKVKEIETLNYPTLILNLKKFLRIILVRDLLYDRLFSES